MKTPEEIKAGLLCAGPCNYCPYKGRIMSDGGCRQAVSDDAIAYIQQLEDHIREVTKLVPKWISAKEQSEPTEDGVYYCYGYWIGSGREQAETAEYLGGEWKIVNNFVLTHWMPLPKPPKEG